MSLYFLDLHEFGREIIDAEGVEAADRKAIRELALRAARDVMSGEVKEGRLCLSCHIDVLDKDRRSVMKIRFADAIAITGLASR